MNGQWAECPRENNQGRWARFYVAMNPKGDIKLSRFTMEMLDCPEAFLLLYDHVNHRIGLKPARLSTKNAYPASPRGPRGGKVIRANRLFDQFGITLTTNMRFTRPEIDEDGILLLDLRKAIPAPRRQAVVR